MSDAKPAPNLPDFMREHVRSYLATDGQKGHMWLSPRPGALETTTLLLTTTGRRSGERYIFPLIYSAVPGGYAIIASKGGSPEHPGWYLNLVENPQVEVQVLAEKFTARARTVAGEERRRIWDKMAVEYPPYTLYAQSTQREIPVILLEAE